MANTPLSPTALADFGCGLCEWERRPVGTKHAELVRVKQCASCRLGSLRENAASSTGYEAVDAYRDAVLADERQRLLALTPEQVVEEAAKAMWRRHWEGADEAPPEHWDAMPEVGRRYFTEMADAAAALLTADLSAEVQRLRGEREDLRDALYAPETDDDGGGAVAEIDRLKSRLASLRASHQEVIRVVREWQEARKAKLDLEDDPAGTHSRTVIERAVEREAEARFALAALDLGGAE